MVFCHPKLQRRRGRQFDSGDFSTVGAFPDNLVIDLSWECL